MIGDLKIIIAKYAPRILRRTANALPLGDIRYRVAEKPAGFPRVLVCGVYVADKENSAAHLVENFSGARSLDVTQRWCCMRGHPPSPALERVTAIVLPDYKPKWTVMAELMADDWAAFDFVIFCDDDIEVGAGFLDAFIALQQHYDFAVAQPARTIRSYVAWKITRRRFLGRARETRFVESGPLVSMDKRFLPMALPFSDLSPMGWGYDHVWPLLARDAGLKMGIIDATSVDHRMRPQSALYDTGKELATAIRYLDRTPHLPREELVTLRRHFR